MFPNLSAIYERALIFWVRASVRFAWVVVALAMAVTAATGLYLAENMRINTSTTDMLSPELEFRRHARERSAAFPQTSDNLLIVVEGQTPDAADETALALGDRFRSDPRLFGSVYDPAGDDFFRRNGLLYLETDELFELSDRLAEAQPFLATLWRDPSLTGLFTMLERIFDHLARADADSPIDVDRILGALVETAEAQVAGRFHELSWRLLMEGEEEGGGPYRRFIVIQPALDFGSLRPADAAVERIEEIVGEMDLSPEKGIRVRLTGSAALEQEELESVEQGMGLAGILSLTLVIGLLVIGLRRFRVVVSAILTLVMGLVWTAGFAILTLGALNLISVAFAVLFIGLSVDFGIHFCLRYQEDLDGGADRNHALETAAGKIGGALTLTAVSAAIAFYSFLPTDYLGLAELGLIAGTGMFIALFANLTVLPAILTLFPAGVSGKAASGSASLRRLGLRFREWVRDNARPVVFMFGGLGLASIATIPFADFDFDPLNLKNRSMPAMATLVDLMEDPRTSPYTINVLAANLGAAKDLAGRLVELESVESVESIVDYVPTDQDEKLDVIAGMALYLAPALAVAPDRAEAGDGARLDSVRKFAARLEEIERQPLPHLDGNSVSRLKTSLERLLASGVDGVRELEKRFLRHLPRQLALLKRSLDAGPVILADLPRDVFERQVTSDGRVNVKVYPKADLRDRSELEAIVTAVRDVAPAATGSPVVILEAGKAVLGAFFEAGALAIVVIAVMLVFVMRRMADVAFVFLPLFLAGALSLAATVLFGISFNFANVIVLPLLFGLGVAGAIHLVSRDRAEGDIGKSFATSTPRAVVFSALTTIGSFGSIALSSHPGTSSMGLLLTIAISLTLPCTLVFLPALMAFTSSRKD